MSDFNSYSTQVQPDPYKRVNYTMGLVLGVDEFAQEQTYFMEKDRLHNRALHGYGTVCGLHIEVYDDTVKVTSGLAVNPQGKEIRVEPDQCASINEWLALEKNQSAVLEQDPQSPPGAPPEQIPLSLYINLCYLECETDDVPIPGAPCRTQEETMAASRITESFDLNFSLEPPQQVEEKMVRRFGDFLSRIEITSEVEGCSREEMENLVRDLKETDSTSISSPPLASPPHDKTYPINPEDAEEILRAVFRVWVTEKRPKLDKDEKSCASGPPKESCVLLGRLDFIVNVNANWKVEGKVNKNEDDRPVLLHARLFQEYMLRGNRDINEHGLLTGLEDDDHKQYLLVDKTDRALIEDLDAGGNRVTHLAEAVDDGDAVPKNQAVIDGDPAGGDLGGTYPNPAVIKLRGNTLAEEDPQQDGQVLTWDDADNHWEPRPIPQSDHGLLDGLEDDDHQQYHNDARGDARYSQINHTHALDNLSDVNAPSPSNRQVLTWNSISDQWTAQAPLAGVTDHGALAGLENDDHEQYVLADGSRALTGDLSAGNHKIADLAPASVNGDAVRFEQAIKVNDPAGGDLGDTYPKPSVTGIQKRSVSGAKPSNGQMLTWNEKEKYWEPQTPSCVQAPSGTYVVVAAGYFNADGTPVNDNFIYNGLQVKAETVNGNQTGDYYLIFNGYKKPARSHIYIVKGTVQATKYRSTFQFIGFGDDTKGIKIQIKNTEDQTERPKFMVEISAFGKIPG